MWGCGAASKALPAPRPGGLIESAGLFLAVRLSRPAAVFVCFLLSIASVNTVQGQEVNSRDDLRRTQLHVAAWAGDEDWALELISNGADVDLAENSGTTALHYASLRGHTGLVQLLLAHGSNIDALDEAGETPLHKAAFGGSLEVSSLLIEHGADITAQTENRGVTPLHHASYMGHASVVELLVANGASIEETRTNGSTPLSIAASQGRAEVVGFLLGKGAITTARDSRGATPLHWASKGTYDGILELLLAEGADVDARDDYGEAAIDWALDRRGSASTVALLREHGAKERSVPELDHTQGTTDDFSIPEFHAEWHDTAVETGLRLQLGNPQSVPRGPSRVVAWNPGAQHVIRGKVAITSDGVKYLFFGELENPFNFRVDRRLGYVFVSGRGIVIGPDGTTTQLSAPK